MFATSRTTKLILHIANLTVIAFILLPLVIGGRRLGLRVMLPYLLSILLILPLIWPGN